MTAPLSSTTALLPPSMQAAFVPAYGAPEVLRLTELPVPVPAEDQVLVQVHASPITHGDQRLRSGDFPGISWLPGRMMMGLTGPRSAIPGSNYAGRIVAVGAEITRFSVGDDVFGSTQAGAHAEYLVAAEDSSIAALPAGLSHAEAAALPYGAVTALHFLSTLGQLQAGEQVLIIGAAGGTGRQAVQLARHLGAEVTAVVSAKDADLVRSLGADHVIDRHTRDFHTEDARYDLILDPIDVSTFARCRRVLRPQGRYLGLHLTGALLLQMALTSRSDGQRALGGVALSDQESIETVRALAEQGALRPVLGRRFPLDQIAEANAWQESGGERATVVVEMPAANRLGDPTLTGA